MRAWTTMPRSRSGVTSRPQPTATRGTTRWSRRLAMPCVARPVLVGGRAFVPGYGGRVEEIEVNDGALRGYYELGQPLTVGGVWQPGTSLVYFAADNFCVYALDV